MTETKTCQHCGAEMTRAPRLPRSLWEKRRWCNKTCMDAARAPKDRACQRCETMFRPKANRKRGTPYCSRKCANVGRPIKGPYRKVRDGEKVRLAHRVTKERELGRPLTSDEIVHHVDHDKSNNDPGNLKITTMPEHSRHHMRGNQHARRS